jgi:hypothetical protein
MTVGQMAQLVQHKRYGHYAMRWEYGKVSQAFKCGTCGTRGPIVEPTVNTR